MNSLWINTFRLCFCWICIVTVTFMVGYWFHKYEIEDRDIGVVDYQSFAEANEVDFPVPYLCFLNPFLKKKFKDIDAEVNVTAYLQYLKGDIFDKSFRNIDYQNVTLDLEEYFVTASEKFLNQSEFQKSNRSFVHKEIFSGVFYHGDFVKCFSFESELKYNHHIHEIALQYNKTKLFDDLGVSDESSLDFYFNIYYPDQFLLKINTPVHMSMSHLSYNLNMWIGDLEMLTRRTTRKKKCTQTKKSFDDLVLSEHIKTVGCRPPYLGSHTEFPMCNTQEKIREGMYEFKSVRNKYYPKACTRISKITVTRQASAHTEDLGYWILGITYPEEVRLITQSKEVDVHTLIGNIGGYIGLFLGIL